MRELVKTDKIYKLSNADEIDEFKGKMWGSGQTVSINAKALKFLLQSTDHALGFSDDGEYVHTVQVTDDALKMLRRMVDQLALDKSHSLAE